ncbi:midnolin homolog [Zootermopsis nevadensis]|uniref:midnolin homolog n=1 Tax=Zootermopsis nevadensis TaxID=136037 RepID=UPI000B8E3B0D|nr:midnolin homolog [Zootermopsis nevadensis]
MDTGGGNAGASDAAKANSNSTSETSQHSGCGCASGTTITVRVTPTTGGQFDLQMAKTESVENLKKVISKKLKVPKERICLLHRDRQLRDGSLQENQLMDGSRLTLLPSVETGLLVGSKFAELRTPLLFAVGGGQQVAQVGGRGFSPNQRY